MLMQIIRTDMITMRFLYITEGEGLHFIDFEAYPIKPPMLYFLAKNQTHYWHIQSSIKGYAMLFPEEFLGVLGADNMREHDINFFQLVERTPYLSIGDDNKSMLKQIVDDLATEFNREKSRSLSLLRAYLHVLITQLRRSYLDHQTGEYIETAPHYVNQFQQLLSQHFITEHSVQYYADKIGISTTHLNDSVKNATGNTPGQLIRQKLVVEAKRLLVHSSATVSEIGYHLNFEDSSYFARFFKRETEMSPSVFRHQFSNNINETEQSKEQGILLLFYIYYCLLFRSHRIHRIASSLALSEVRTERFSIKSPLSPALKSAILSKLGSVSQIE